MISPYVTCKCNKRHLPTVAAIMAVMQGFSVSKKCSCGRMVALPVVTEEQVMRADRAHREKHAASMAYSAT